MESSRTSTTELAILGRVLAPHKPTFTPEAAKAMLELDFSPEDKERMRDLCAKAKDGPLDPREKKEIDNYERVGHLLNLMQSQARCSINRCRD